MTRNRAAVERSLERFWKALLLTALLAMSGAVRAQPAPPPPTAVEKILDQVLVERDLEGGRALILEALPGALSQVDNPSWTARLYVLLSALATLEGDEVQAQRLARRAVTLDLTVQLEPQLGEGAAAVLSRARQEQRLRVADARLVFPALPVPVQLYVDFVKTPMPGELAVKAGDHLIHVEDAGGVLAHAWVTVISGQTLEDPRPLSELRRALERLKPPELAPDVLEGLLDRSRMARADLDSRLAGLELELDTARAAGEVERAACLAGEQVQLNRLSQASVLYTQRLQRALDAQDGPESTHQVRMMELARDEAVKMEERVAACLEKPERQAPPRVRVIQAPEPPPEPSKENPVSRGAPERVDPLLPSALTLEIWPRLSALRPPPANLFGATLPPRAVLPPAPSPESAARPVVRPPSDKAEAVEGAPDDAAAGSPESSAGATPSARPVQTSAAPLTSSQALALASPGRRLVASSHASLSIDGILQQNPRHSTAADLLATGPRTPSLELRVTPALSVEGEKGYLRARGTGAVGATTPLPLLEVAAQLKPWHDARGTILELGAEAGQEAVWADALGEQGEVTRRRATARGWLRLPTPEALPSGLWVEGGLEQGEAWDKLVTQQRFQIGASGRWQVLPFSGLSLEAVLGMQSGEGPDAPDPAEPPSRPEGLARLEPSPIGYVTEVQPMLVGARDAFFARLRVGVEGRLAKGLALEARGGPVLQRTTVQGVSSWMPATQSWSGFVSLAGEGKGLRGSVRLERELTSTAQVDAAFWSGLSVRVRDGGKSRWVLDARGLAGIEQAYRAASEGDLLGVGWWPKQPLIGAEVTGGVRFWRADGPLEATVTLLSAQRWDVPELGSQTADEGLEALDSLTRTNIWLGLRGGF